MAKSKPVKPVPTKSAKRRADVVAADANHNSRSAAKTDAKAEAEVPRVPGAISDVEIGHVAGDVWGALVRDGTLTVAAIKKTVDAPGDVVMAAIGWLAREEKLAFSSQGRSVKISLR
jgi:hypothetical protein